MTRAGRLGRAALLGVVCGMRSAMGPAVLARRGRLPRTRPIVPGEWAALD